MGLVEAHGRLAEAMLETVIRETMPRNLDEWEECLDVVSDVKNQMMRLRGHSPEQIVFGRDRPLPEDLFSEDSYRPPR